MLVTSHIFHESHELTLSSTPSSPISTSFHPHCFNGLIGPFANSLIFFNLQPFPTPPITGYWSQRHTTLLHETARGPLCPKATGIRNPPKAAQTSTYGIHEKERINLDWTSLSSVGTLGFRQHYSSQWQDLEEGEWWHRYLNLGRELEDGFGMFDKGGLLIIVVRRWDRSFLLLKYLCLLWEFAGLVDGF